MARDQDGEAKTVTPLERYFTMLTGGKDPHIDSLMVLYETFDAMPKSERPVCLAYLNARFGKSDSDT